jgi:hypothetical protein
MSLDLKKNLMTAVENNLMKKYIIGNKMLSILKPLKNLDQIFCEALINH